MGRRRAGFTIVEMLMVIGVLAILMGIVSTAATAAIRQARDRKLSAVQQVIQAGIATYRSQRDVWPPDGGQLEKWSQDGLTSDSINGVKSGRHLAFLSATEYDDMMYELARVSVGTANASPIMDFGAVVVATKSVANNGRGHGQDFSEAIKKNKKHGKTMTLREMCFGYNTSEKGYFRRFFVQYNADSDNVIVMTESQYRAWWSSLNPNKSIQWPTGYPKL